MLWAKGLNLYRTSRFENWRGTSLQSLFPLFLCLFCSIHNNVEARADAIELIESEGDLIFRAPIRMPIICVYTLGPMAQFHPELHLLLDVDFRRGLRRDTQGNGLGLRAAGRRKPVRQNYGAGGSFHMYSGQLVPTSNSGGLSL